MSSTDNSSHIPLLHFTGHFRMLFALANTLLTSEEIFFIVTFYNLFVPVADKSAHHWSHQFCIKNCCLILSEKTRCKRELGLSFQMG